MKKVFSLTLATAALGSIVCAQVPQQIDIHNLPGGAKVVEDVVIPVPSEIFNVLDRIGKPNWPEVLRSTKNTPTPGEREQIALVLGTVIAEGFIAVEAENDVEVKNIGKVVIVLADALNVGKSVRKRASAIIDGADKKNWKAVRQELDKAQHDVQAAMQEMNDEALAQLVSLGGWLRGTEALTTVVERDYKKDSADLLHQPALIEYFAKRIDNMPKKLKEKPLTRKMAKGLAEIRPLMGNEGTEISEKTVKEIHASVGELIAAIHAKANP